jgi:hypothetical protein
MAGRVQGSIQLAICRARCCGGPARTPNARFPAIPSPAQNDCPGRSGPGDRMDFEHQYYSSPEELPPIAPPAPRPATPPPSAAPPPPPPARGPGLFGLPFHVAYHGQFPDALKLKRKFNVGPLQLSVAGGPAACLQGGCSTAAGPPCRLRAAAVRAPEARCSAPNRSPPASLRHMGAPDKGVLPQADRQGAGAGSSLARGCGGRPPQLSPARLAAAAALDSSQASSPRRTAS